MGDRPGTMIYFDDLLPLFDVLKEGEAGQLLRAIVFYGKYGEVPDFSDAATLAIAWGFIRPKIDRDADKYEKEISKRQYATYCREAKKNGEEPLPFDEWHHVISHDITWYPTGNETGTVNEITTATGKETTSTTETTAKTGDVDGGGTGKGITGEPFPPPPPPAWGREYEPMTNNDFERQRRERMQAVAGYR